MEMRLQTFEKTHFLDPKNADALFNGGTALTRLGRDAEAIVFFNKTLAIKPDYLSALIEKAKSLTRLDHHKEVIDTIEHALKLTQNMSDFGLFKGSPLTSCLTMKRRSKLSTVVLQSSQLIV